MSVIGGEKDDMETEEPTPTLSMQHDDANKPMAITVEKRMSYNK